MSVELCSDQIHENIESSKSEKKDYRQQLESGPPVLREFRESIL